MQTFALMKKWSTMYWRSPAYNLTRFLMTTLIALFYGTMYLQKGHLPKSGMGPCPSYLLFRVWDPQASSHTLDTQHHRQGLTRPMILSVRGMSCTVIFLKMSL